jgi:uncharacterized membrane protein YcaP (DUF421 family)
MDIAIRAVVLYAFLIFVMRVTGRRELSTLSPVDLVLLIVLGDAIQQGLTQDDYSVTGAVIAVSTLATMQVLSSYVSFKSRRVRRVLEGEPIVLVQDGRVITRNIERERMTVEEVCESMRLEQVARLEDVEWAILESNGNISFIEKRPEGSRVA